MVDRVEYYSYSFFFYFYFFKRLGFIWVSFGFRLGSFLKPRTNLNKT